MQDSHPTPVLMEDQTQACLASLPSKWQKQMHCLGL